jgi:hypothetical protein
MEDNSLVEKMKRYQINYVSVNCFISIFEIQVTSREFKERMGLDMCLL